MDVQRSDVRIRMRRRRWWWVTGSGGALLLLLVLANLSPAIPAVDRGGVIVDSVRRGNFVRNVRGSGVLEPKERRWITAETSARVDRLLLKPGSIVSADSVILELVDPDLDNLLLTARAAVIEAEAQLATHRANLRSELLDRRAALAKALANIEIARAQVQVENEVGDIFPQIEHKKNLIILEQHEQLGAIERERLAEYEKNVNHQLAAEQAHLDQVAAVRDLRQRQKDALRVRAGINGVVEQVPVEEGQAVAAGANIARVARLDQFIARLRIAETQAKDIAIGQQATVDLRSSVVQAKVVRVDAAIHAGTVDVDVELAGGAPPGARPDLSVDGTVEIQRVENVLYMGVPALSQPQSETTVFRLNPEGSEAVRQKVRFGRGSVDKIEVLMGLNEGDQVILSDISAFAEQDRIRIR